MEKQKQFARLFEPISIGQMRVRNRIVVPAMGTNYGSEDGYVTERIKDYYEERAKGGAGLVIVEVACIDSTAGKTIINQLSIDDDKFIPGLSEVAQIIQQHGARAAVQLEHSGRSAKQSFTHIQPVAPSAIPEPGGDMPRELTTGEIAQLVTRYADGAERAKKAGFDAIEIHSAHCYLLAQFLSLWSNKRRDAYGGDLKNRARMLLEVVAAVRGKVGRSYPVWCRINGMEYIENGLTLEEAKEVARMLQDAGVDAIHVSAWPISSFRLPPMDESPGNLVHLAEAVKNVVSVPVIAVGRITPEVAEEVLQEGKADLVAMGKALIADPHLPNKLASGRSDDIIPCIGCLYCHHTLRGFGTEHGSVRCCVNTMTGREREYAIKPAEKAKKVLIAGSGPAGMEAARVTKLRGHEPILYDKNDRLGGQLLLARIPPHKNGIDLLIEYLTREMAKLGVRVELGKEVTPQLIEELKPDAVIIATGATVQVPGIPGLDRENVIWAEAALTGKAEVGDNVVVIGAGLVGCETAEFLAEKGKKVTIVEMLEEISIGVWSELRIDLPQRLAAEGVEILMGTTCRELTDRGLDIVTSGGGRITLPTDTVVVAAGAKPDQELYQEIRGMVSESYLIGDCVEPRRILEAIDDGSRIAREI